MGLQAAAPPGGSRDPARGCAFNTRLIGPTGGAAGGMPLRACRRASAAASPQGPIQAATDRIDLERADCQGATGAGTLAHVAHPVPAPGGRLRRAILRMVKEVLGCARPLLKGTVAVRRRFPRTPREPVVLGADPAQTCWTCSQGGSRRGPRASLWFSARTPREPRVLGADPARTLCWHS